MTTPALIERYFDLASLADTDAYLAQFAQDADVEDEGHDYHGIDDIRAWRTEVPLVTYAVREVTAEGATHVARAEISGDFAGSPVELSFRFVFADDGRIDALAIRT